MTKKDYINAYQNRIDKYIPEFKKDHKIDDNFIYSHWLGTWYKLSIDDCIKVMELNKRKNDYIYSLKKNDKISVSTYGSTYNAKIDKINLSKRKTKNGKTIISSFTVSRDIMENNTYSYNDKIKIENINFENKNIYDINRAFDYASGRFTSISSYVVRDINTILNT
jgi:hypothetical protein